MFSAQSLRSLKIRRILNGILPSLKIFSCHADMKFLPRHTAVHVRCHAPTKAAAVLTSEILLF